MGTNSSTLYHRSQNLWLEFCPISKNSSKNFEPRPGSKLLFLKTINYGWKPWFRWTLKKNTLKSLKKKWLFELVIMWIQNGKSKKMISNDGKDKKVDAYKGCLIWLRGLPLWLIWLRRLNQNLERYDFTRTLPCLSLGQDFSVISVSTVSFNVSHSVSVGSILF